MIIGITGNSGSGKTSICEEIEQIKQNGKPPFVINADKIVKELSAPEKEYFKKIVEIFGQEILLQNGEIDKVKLANIIFSDYEKKEKLNYITYKYVAKEIEKRARTSKSDLILIDAPLLIESKLNQICDVVISIIANQNIKIDRICKRDNIDRKTAKKRIDAQTSDEVYIKNSNYVIINNEENSIKEYANEIIEIIKSDILYNPKTVIIQSGELKILQFKKLLEYNNIINHAFTLKPLDFGNNDTYIANKETYDNNYKKMCKLLNLEYKNIVRPYQTHTSNVKKITNENGIFAKELYDIDGLITDKKRTVLSLTFADCTPIYLFDKEKNIIGNIHSGWEGTLKQIAKEAVNKMINEFNSNPKNIICVIGPTIRKCHFEVDEGIKNRFCNTFKNTFEDKHFIHNGEIKDGKQKYYIDTVYLNKEMLIKCGLLEENIVDCNICTVENNRFIHSYRVEKQEAGRNTAIISLI